MFGSGWSSMVAGPAVLLHWIMLPIQAQIVPQILVCNVAGITHADDPEGDQHYSNAYRCPMPAVIYKIVIVAYCYRWSATKISRLSKGNRLKLWTSLKAQSHLNLLFYITCN